MALEKPQYQIPTRHQSSTEPGSVLTNDAGYGPNPDCPVCEGAGFVYPVEFGKVIYTRVKPCQAPDCLEDNKRKFLKGERQLIKSGIEPKKTFDNFAVGIPGVRKAYNAAKAWSLGDTDVPFLVIYGIYGCGKSHLCNAAYLNLIDRCVPVQLLDCYDLLKDLRKNISDEMLDSRVETLQEASCLILDDFKPTESTDWAVSKVQEILFHRHKFRLLTMVTTNDSLDMMEKACPRLLSRFQEPEISTLICNEAPDYRIIENRMRKDR